MLPPAVGELLACPCKRICAAPAVNSVESEPLWQPRLRPWSLGNLGARCRGRQPQQDVLGAALQCLRAHQCAPAAAAALARQPPPLPPTAECACAPCCYACPCLTYKLPTLLLTGRTAPRPGAAAETFTFGRLPEQGGAAPPAAPADRNRSNFDPDPEQLRWWQQPRNAVTVSGSSNKDIEAWWGSAGGDAVKELVNAGARTANSELQSTASRRGACDCHATRTSWHAQCTPSHPAAEAQGLGSSIKASLGDPEEFPLAQVKHIHVLPFLTIS